MSVLILDAFSDFVGGHYEASDIQTILKLKNEECPFKSLLCIMLSGAILYFPQKRCKTFFCFSPVWRGPLTYLKILYVQRKQIYCTCRDVLLLITWSVCGGVTSHLWIYFTKFANVHTLHSIIYYMLFAPLHLLCLSSFLWLTYRLSLNHRTLILKQNLKGARMCWQYTLTLDVWVKSASKIVHSCLQ